MKTGQIVTHRGMDPTLYGLRMLFGTQVPVGWDKVRLGFKFVGGVVGTGDGMEPRKEPRPVELLRSPSSKSMGRPRCLSKATQTQHLRFF